MPGVLPCIDEGANAGTEPDATSTEPGDSELIDVANQDLAILLSSDSSILEDSLFNPSNFEPNGDAYPPLFTDDLDGRIGQLFSNTLEFPTGIDVFSLAPGYTVNAGAYLGNNRFIDPNAVAEVPEPSTLALFGAGLLGLGALRRRRKAKA